MGADYLKNRKPPKSFGKMLECTPSFLDTLKTFPFNAKTSLRAFNKNNVAKELIRQFLVNPSCFERFQGLITARQREVQQANDLPQAPQEDEEQNEDDNTSNEEEEDDNTSNDEEDAKSFLERAMLETDGLAKLVDRNAKDLHKVLKTSKDHLMTEHQKPAPEPPDQALSVKALCELWITREIRQASTSTTRGHFDCIFKATTDCAT